MDLMYAVPQAVIHCAWRNRSLRCSVSVPLDLMVPAVCREKAEQAVRLGRL